MPRVEWHQEHNLTLTYTTPKPPPWEHHPESNNATPLNLRGLHLHPKRSRQQRGEIILDRTILVKQIVLLVEVCTSNGSLQRIKWKNTMYYFLDHTAVHMTTYHRNPQIDVMLHVMGHHHPPIHPNDPNFFVCVPSAALSEPFCRMKNSWQSIWG